MGATVGTGAGVGPGNVDRTIGTMAEEAGVDEGFEAPDRAIAGVTTGAAVRAGEGEGPDATDRSAAGATLQALQGGGTANVD